MEFGNYKYGMKEGKWFKYDEDGNLIDFPNYLKNLKQKSDS
jgi:antitoxin component YwqK of YwqJK toxin-antitoxin module